MAGPFGSNLPYPHPSILTLAFCCKRAHHHAHTSHTYLAPRNSGPKPPTGRTFAWKMIAAPLERTRFWWCALDGAPLERTRLCPCAFGDPPLPMPFCPCAFGGAPLVTRLCPCPFGGAPSSITKGAPPKAHHQRRTPNRISALDDSNRRFKGLNWFIRNYLNGS